ncbi:hypothetical protein EWH99_10945 [Sporolactobacillus sp. THM7-7]|nr:hypothetical protein EWH99_10945 [Sporolactobacillus sp. THM7-7]
MRKWPLATNEQYLQAIKSEMDRIGSIKYKDYMDHHDPFAAPSAYYIRKRFGTWSAMMRQINTSGKNTPQGSERIPLQSDDYDLFFYCIKREIERIGSTDADMYSKHRRKYHSPSMAYIEQHYGPWALVLKKLGYET